jgi:hypothetical protein
MKTLKGVLAVMLWLAGPAAAWAQAEVQESWVATDLKTHTVIALTGRGATLTGSITQEQVTEQRDISEGAIKGAINGPEITFEASKKGGPIITFQGTVNCEAIAFTRKVNGEKPKDNGGNGILGADGPEKFTAKWVGPDRSCKSRAITPASTPATDAPPAPPVPGNVGDTQVTGSWVKTGQTSTKIVLKANGVKLTGSIVEQVTENINISKGAINGPKITFEASKNGATITYTGTVTCDQVVFTRSVNGQAPGAKGGNGILGAGGPKEFTARRAGPAVLPCTAQTKEPELILDMDGKSVAPVQEIVGKTLKVTIQGLNCEPAPEIFWTLYYEPGQLEAPLDDVKALPKNSAIFCTDGNLESTTLKNLPAGAALRYFLVRNLTKDERDSQASSSSQTPMSKDFQAQCKDAVQSGNDSEVDECLKQIETEAQGRQDNYSRQAQNLSDAMKAFTGMSTPVAAETLRALVCQWQDVQKELAHAKADLKAVQEEEKRQKGREAAKKAAQDVPTDKVLRAGVVPITDPHKKIVYYRFISSDNRENPYRLERMAEFPVFTVRDNLGLAIVNHKRNEAPSDFQLSFGTDKGAFVDVAPVRPTIAVPPPATGGAAPLWVGVTSGPLKADFSSAYVDRVLAFANKLPGESVPLVTVSSYATVVTVNQEDTTDGTTTKKLTTVTKTIKILDSERWPQVHSLYYFNISTGVIASWLRDPAYSRVLTVAGVPATTNPVTAGTPPQYKTAEDRGSARAMPVMAFTAYWWPRDVQVRYRLKELTPSPTIAFSLSSPKDDFFFGFSSEILRNVQLVYGCHYGRVTRLGPSGVDDPTSNAAPATVKRFAGNVFVGMTFNVNFIKDLFK